MTDEQRGEADVPGEKDEDITRVPPLSGLDRSGLGEKGWAEVPEDRIGGHPELEHAPRTGPHGGLNGDPADDPFAHPPDRA